MPRILFTRTPSEAEAGPGHDFAAGRIYDVAPRSARRWLELGAALPAPEAEASLSDFVPVGTIAAAEFEAVEAGGEAPPVIVPARHIRHAAAGKWHAYEGERRLTERAVAKEEAQAIADACPWQ